MSVQMPDYENCGVNVVSSIAQYCGMAPLHKTHPFTDALLQKKEYQNIILMLFDGMGVDLLQKALPEDAFLRRHLQHTLSAVFPSTTTCATTAIECGQMPREHGWLGWTLRFPQIQQSVDVYTNHNDRGEIAASYHVGNRFIPRDFIYPHITACGRFKACSISPFGDVKINTLPELIDRTIALAKDSEKRYMYCYWPEPDSSMHRYGCYHEKSIKMLSDINNRVEKMVSQLPEDTLLLLTADHGLIDADIRYLDHYPDLMKMLEFDATLELRAVSFHVKPEWKKAFPETFKRCFEDHFRLITKNEFIETYLGSGAIRENVYDTVGDYVAISLDEVTLMNHMPSFLQIGHHAGLTKQEMQVPLIVAKE
ncbi:MAG: alkaline phosphatase family protein [Clostridia bacterium]|nr:alkaline phosphatase family protein [Clostridia bacterium]